MYSTSRHPTLATSDGERTREKRATVIFSRSHPECFIGITSWNSEAFLGPCIDQVNRTAHGRVRVVVLDNASTDRSAEVARARGAEVIVRHCSQSQALNALLAMSSSRYTLLIHSDVILLNDDWLDLCAAQISGNVALLSPEDIGCGPYTRPWGKGMPESSFLFFDTHKAMSARRLFWRQRFKMKLPFRAFDFTGEHITYNVPDSVGCAWLHVAHDERAHLDPRARAGLHPEFQAEVLGEMLQPPALWSRQLL